MLLKITYLEFYSMQEILVSLILKQISIFIHTGMFILISVKIYIFNKESVFEDITGRRSYITIF